ncbi:cyclic peptide export ABC transporter [Aquimarina rhabdastrellae]
MLKLNLKSILYLLLYAIPNTILSFGIIYVINNVLAGNRSFDNEFIPFLFVWTVAFTYLINITFQRWLNKHVFSMLYANEKKLFEKILRSPLSSLEKHGSQRFYTAMNDLRTFSTLPFAVTHTITSILMLVLGIGYMYTLSAISATIVIGIIILVAGCYFMIMNTMSKKVEILRGNNDQYYGFVRDLIAGFKELKLSLSRRENIMGKYLVPNRDKSEELDFQVNYVFLSINLISQYGLYLVIAAILFGLPALGFLEREDVIAYVVVILFLSGPINNLINLQQTYTSIIVANKRIKNFAKDFQANDKEEKLQVINQPMNSLKFKGIYFNYQDSNNEKAFSLGPINLEITKGEVVFIVGGNGSGKSTFINILTGLYEPTGGNVILNDTKNININSELQDSMTTVFTNNHLFSNNYENYKLEGNTEYESLLKIMKLDNVVTDDKEESARRNFSKGQSKRMSMIFALLEKKPILILDEWAADQDPHFRKYFYEELIPSLKKEGKTIIAVTHDDAYFHHADRIVKFDSGKIVKDVKTEKEMLTTENLWYK